MIVKVGDKIKCKEDTMDLFLKSGEIAYVADIVYGVSHPYYVVKDKSLIGTSHWDLNPNTYTLLIPDEIELLEKFDGLDDCEYGLFHKARLEKVLLDKEDNAQDMTIEVKDNKVRVFLGDKEVTGLTKVEFSANLEEAPKLNLEMIPKKEMVK